MGNIFPADKNLVTKAKKIGFLAKMHSLGRFWHFPCSDIGKQRAQNKKVFFLQNNKGLSTYYVLLGGGGGGGLPDLLQ